jgi:4-amino-4-deoxy-L-arabinose transferase-like glycosyltransferase
MSMELTTAAFGPSDGPTAGTAGTLARSRSYRRDLVRLFLVLLALTFVLRLPAFFVPVFNSDETFLATQAHVIGDGGQLYEDAIDRKPPIVPYLYAATFSFFETTALWSVRVVAMLAVALTALLLAIEARRRYGERAGWIAGVLFVLAMVAFAPQDGQAANFEVFMLPSMTAAILFARRGRGFLAGAAIAAAALANRPARPRSCRCST